MRLFFIQLILWSSLVAAETLVPGKLFPTLALKSISECPNPAVVLPEYLAVNDIQQCSATTKDLGSVKGKNIFFVDFHYEYKDRHIPSSMGEIHQSLIVRKNSPAEFIVLWAYTGDVAGDPGLIARNASLVEVDARNFLGIELCTSGTAGCRQEFFEFTGTGFNYLPSRDLRKCYPDKFTPSRAVSFDLLHKRASANLRTKDQPSAGGSGEVVYELEIKSDRIVDTKCTFQKVKD